MSHTKNRTRLDPGSRISAPYDHVHPSDGHDPPFYEP